MKIGKKARLGSAAVLVTAGVSAALLSNIAPAAATYSSQGVYIDVKIGSTATLIAKGAAVTIPVTTTCKAFSYYGVSAYVQVSQASGKKLATGSAGTPTFLCDGVTRTFQVSVTASGSSPFAKGQGYVHASLSSCYEICAEDDASATVTFLAK